MGTKQYYYIDYKLFVDTVKWRIHQMEEIFKEKKENVNQINLLFLIEWIQYIKKIYI